MSAKPPAIGTLTDRVSVQKRVMSAEPEGGHGLAYVPSGTVWARVRRLSARVAVMGDARGSLASHAVVMRYRGDLGPGDRIVYRGRRLDIVGAADLDGRRAFLGCTCTEVEASG